MLTFQTIYIQIHSSSFVLRAKCMQFSSISEQSRHSLLSKKLQLWRGWSHVKDLPDNIYSNTFGLHSPWERNIRNLLQFPSEVFLPLKKNAALKGLITTLTFQIKYIQIHSLFISPENETYASRSHSWSRGGPWGSDLADFHVPLPGKSTAQALLWATFSHF